MNFAVAVNFAVVVWRVGDGTSVELSLHESGC